MVNGMGVETSCESGSQVSFPSAWILFGEAHASGPLDAPSIGGGAVGRPWSRWTPACDRLHLSTSRDLMDEGDWALSGGLACRVAAGPGQEAMLHTSTPAGFLAHSINVELSFMRLEIAFRVLKYDNGVEIVDQGVALGRERGQHVGHGRPDGADLRSQAPPFERSDD